MPETRQRILTAAVDLMRARGFRGTGLKGVTTAAAATTGSLYHFFPGGKDDLVEAAVREDGASHEAVFLAIARQADSPGAAVDTFFSQAADVLEATGYVDLCPVGTIAGEVASTHDRLRIACDDVFRGWERAIVAELTSAGLDPARAAELGATAVAALLGGFVLVRARRNGDPLRDAGRRLGDLVDTQVSERLRTPEPS